MAPGWLQVDRAAVPATQRSNLWHAHPRLRVAPTESYHTARVRQQRAIAYLGDLPREDPALIADRGKLQGRSAQLSLCDETTEPQ